MFQQFTRNLYDDAHRSLGDTFMHLSKLPPFDTGKERDQLTKVIRLLQTAADELRILSHGMQPQDKDASR